MLSSTNVSWSIPQYIVSLFTENDTAQKVSKYGVFSDPCFPVSSPNTAKKGSEKTPHLDTFHAV